MTEVLFVEITAGRLENRVCELAEEIYEQGNRLQIIAASRQQASRLDDLLWTHRPESFVPHGILEAEAGDPSLPVVITSRQAKVPGIDQLLMTDYCSPELVARFTRAVHFVVLDSTERRASSRNYWVQLRDLGLTLRHEKL